MAVDGQIDNVTVLPSGVQDLDFQNRILEGVSRTFALTIPQLPHELRDVVANAYLLCRIADTIEDEISLSVDEKQRFHQQFVTVVAGKRSATAFANELGPLLSEATLPAERDLVAQTERVIGITQGFSPIQRQALHKCVAVMCEGMPGFQRHASLKGLTDLSEMSQYCYFVAGVVGEMLTELFCDYSPRISEHRDTLMELAISFGQGLQMTNILKDIWEDRKRGACWLPRDMFKNYGVSLETMSPDENQAAIANGIDELIAVAHGHLQRALKYTLYIPSDETGIRRFCLWAIGLAVLTLKRIHGTPGFATGQDVKVSRRAVKATVFATNASVKHDRAITALFNLAGRGLPVREITDQRKRYTRWQGDAAQELASESQV